MIPRLYLITDRALAPDPAAAVAAALSAIPRGAAVVQLREKELPAREQLALARALLPICRAAGARLLVNDRLDVALAAGADGVHLGVRSVPVAEARALLGADRWIGVSCHSPDELRAAEGADFATFGPCWPTPSKAAFGPPPGLPGLREAVRAWPMLPIFALGSVTAPRAPEALAAGAHGVAAIRAWLDPEPAGATARLHASVCASIGP